jgi:hypothetical protein
VHWRMRDDSWLASAGLRTPAWLSETVFRRRFPPFFPFWDTPPFQSETRFISEHG